jgi:hypothetical protein
MISGIGVRGTADEVRNLIMSQEETLRQSR